MRVLHDTVQFIGKTTLSQGCCAENAFTYDPYSVFVLKDSRASYSLPRSKEYNRVHYVWAGRNSREDVLVQQRAGHKPRLILNPDKN